MPASLAVLRPVPATLRQMTDEDAEAVVALSEVLWGDPEAPASPVSRLVRARHLLETDPGGAWVAEEGGELVGAALALVREGLWGLSLLIVSPSHQSAGLGRSLLQNTLAYGADAATGLILSSEDPRALRLYSRAGFELRPAIDAIGPVRRPPAPDGEVREVRWPDDRELVDGAGRFVRGAGHGRDLGAWLEAGATVLVHDGGGFGVRNGDEIKLVAAREPAVAAALLRTLLSQVREARVEFIAAGQEWAVATVLDAGLELRPAGAVMCRGELGPMAPYIPSGAYL